MGVEARIVLWAPSEAVAREAAEAAFERMAALERIMSDWREESDLSALSRGAGGGPRRVGPELFRVLDRSLAIAEASEGAFDPTVGPVVRLWRRARQQGTLPPAAALAEARDKVGWRLVGMDPSAGTVALARAGMALDLGGIGKGFACDEAMDVLRDRGLTRVLVALAGDVVCGDPPPGRSSWTVAIGSGGGSLALANAAVSTSGDTEQFVEIGGVRYSHVVDPRTGIGLTESCWVTIVAPDGATADALATAASVLGEERGREVVSRFPGTRWVTSGG
jgi:thiamine biosynthesis lipoprotein